MFLETDTNFKSSCPQVLYGKAVMKNVTRVMEPYSRVVNTAAT